MNRAVGEGGVLEKIGIVCYQGQGGGVRQNWYKTRIRVLSGAGMGGMSRKSRGGGRRWGASGNDAAPSPSSPHVS